MELYFLDGNFDIRGIVENYDSLIWEKRYDSAGKFSLSISPDTYISFNSVYSDSVRYIYHPINREVGIIDSKNFRIDEDGRFTVFSGHMLESILSSRCISQEEICSDTAENIARMLVSKYAVDGSHKIEGLSLGNFNGLTEKCEIWTKGDNLMEKLYSMLFSLGLSYRISYDFENNGMNFEVFAGRDRTNGQSIYPKAVFSESYGNIISYSLDYPVNQYYNFAYTDTSDGVYTLDLTSDGRQRRELYVLASNLRRGDYSNYEYESLISSYTRERMGKVSEYARFRVSLLPSAAPIYRRDFDIGDICEIECASAGISDKMRLMRISEINEKGAQHLEAEFVSAEHI